MYGGGGADLHGVLGLAHGLQDIGLPEVGLHEGGVHGDGDVAVLEGPSSSRIIIRTRRHLDCEIEGVQLGVAGGPVGVNFSILGNQDNCNCGEFRLEFLTLGLRLMASE